MTEQRRRAGDTGIVRLQEDVSNLRSGQAAMAASIEGLTAAVDRHEQDDVRRFEGLYELTTTMGQRQAKQEAYDEQHTELLSTIAAKLDTVAQTQQSIADIPKLIKWAAGLVGGLVALVGALGALSKLPL